ncbi:class I SAM-dependent methyltransferase [Mesorhizobium sp. M2E.F.Ca.ET.209.01.1.1]|nr:class I SAM-dependent methyltransferase [Mesorhizobium sp. M2E.F.Ca.ET.209.01.1.1]
MGQASFPEMYERWLVGPLFRPWAEVTFEEVKLSPGHRVLDIACGTGIVARVAREQLGAAGYVVGIDINAEMLAVARTVAPDIDWRVGNAGALPLRDGEQFDAVVCQQGLQFFPDKAAVTAQMRRALAQGGRLAVGTWRSDEEIAFFRDLRRVAERLLGPIVDLRHSFGNAALIEALLRDAGFHDVRSRTISRRIRFEDGAPLLRLNTMALVGMSAAGKAMADHERKRVVEDIVSGIAPVLQSYTDGSGVAFELSSNLVTANG